MTWKKAGDIATSRLFGSQTKGCPFCGTIVDYVTETGKVISYPGVECCPEALRRQIAWRKGELDQLNKRAADRLRDVEDLQRRSVEGDRSSLALAARAQRSYEALMGPDGEWNTEMRALSNEITRLRKKLASLEDRAA